MALYARYRAPAESGQKLVAPPWSELDTVLADNQRQRSQADAAVLDQPLPEFGCAARREILSEAAAYVTSYSPQAATQVLEKLTGPTGRSQCPPLIATGHQPEIFHPGVWVKNFAAAALARACGGVALNLIIDSDACREATIRVPTGSLKQPRFELVQFDAAAVEMPWEERGVVREGLWQSFAERVSRASEGLLPSMMLPQWWPAVVERHEATGRMGLSIAQARHLDELHYGSLSLELPQSRICQTTAFRRFTCHVLRQLPQFIAAYNESLAAYRAAHHIRNHAHPVPNLGSASPWLEAPFWLWTTAKPRRRPAYVRRERHGLVISDRESFERFLALSDAGDAEDSVAELARWEREGIKLRSRALVTTMFARLALADLFIHGIGGAKYDEATDGVCERFFGISPPRFAAISGTLHLPIARAGDGEEDVRRLHQQLRELTYHPERQLRMDGEAVSPEARRLVAEKRRWVETPKTEQNAAQRHNHIAAANAALQPLLCDQRAEVESRLRSAIQHNRASQVLNSREYAFCLFPVDELHQFLLDFPS